MGRYFPLRCNPFLWTEILESGLYSTETEQEQAWMTLQQQGGFPEPFLRNEATFWRRWKNLRWKQLFREDLRDLTRTLDLDRIETLGTLLLEQAGGQCNWAALAARLMVSQDTIHRWVSHLEALHILFLLRPWSTNVSRSLLKEPRVFFTDWSWVLDEGMRLENMVASQIRASLAIREDQGLGEFGLWYLRDKDRHEADFLVSKNGKPWLVLEVKKSDTRLASGFLHMARQLGAAHNFQLVIDMPPVKANPFRQGDSPLAVPARSFFRDWAME